MTGENDIVWGPGFEWFSENSLVTNVQTRQRDRKDGLKLSSIRLLGHLDLSHQEIGRLLARARSVQQHQLQFSNADWLLAPWLPFFFSFVLSGSCLIWPALLTTDRFSLITLQTAFMHIGSGQAHRGVKPSQKRGGDWKCPAQLCVLYCYVLPRSLSSNIASPY